MLDRQPARPLCLVSCRAPATCRRRHVTETEPTTPRASHPVRTLHQTAPGDRRTSSFVCGIEKCHVGDRDRLFGSSFSTSTGHRKRNPRAALRNARALPSGASLSARETASEGAGRSQITESGQHYLTTTDRPPKPRNHCGRNPKFMTKLRFLIWPAASHLAHTWRTPGAPLNSSSAHSCRTPVALLSHSCRTPVALLSHSCRTPVALLRTPVALLSHSCLIPWRTPGSAGADPPLNSRIRGYSALWAEHLPLARRARVCVWLINAQLPNTVTHQPARCPLGSRYGLPRIRMELLRTHPCPR